MTDEQRPEHSEAPVPSHLLGLEGDDLELVRLADALTALDDGADFSINRDQDQSLAALLDTVTVVRAGLLAATESARFEAFHYDSRGRIQDALPAAARTRRTIVNAPSVPWWRRWQLTVAPVATATAAIIATIFVAGGLSDSGNVTDTQVLTQPLATPDAAVAVDIAIDDALAANLTQLSVEEQLEFLQGTLATLQTRVAAGQTVDPELLNELTTRTSVLTQRLEDQPGQFESAVANSFIETTGFTRVALTQVSVEPGDQPALDAAQASAQDGLVTAASFIAQNPASGADGVTLDVDAPSGN